MENQSISLLTSTGSGLIIWGGSKLLRNACIRFKANGILNNLSQLQMGGGTGNEYTNVIITTKLLNIVVPALIGIGSVIGAAISEFHGDHNTALLLLATGLPHLVEIPFNKKIIKE